MKHISHRKEYFDSCLKKQIHLNAKSLLMFVDVQSVSGGPNLHQSHWQLVNIFTLIWLLLPDTLVVGCIS